MGIGPKIVQMKRALIPYIKNDLPKKIILISGPRQCGKTTLSQMMDHSFDYLNYDNGDHRDRLKNKEWDRKKELIIFDELHKHPKWKSWLKGIYDVEKIPPFLLVTGSAKLNTYKKVGDSLAGRFFSYQLFPLDLKELKLNQQDFNLEKSFQKLLEIGGFPEPFLEGDLDYYRRWKNSHIDIILKQDLINIEKVSNIIGIENLIRLMRKRVGSTISYSNLARDLNVDPKTVKSWLSILEQIYVIFKVPPYSKKIKDSILKAPKYYFYDNGQVEGDSGTKLENLVALSLIKEASFLKDTRGMDVELFFLRNKRGEEVDFLLQVDGKPHFILEVKWADNHFSKNLIKFGELFPTVPKIQLVGNLPRTEEKTIDRLTEMRSAPHWLSSLDLDNRP